MERTGYQPVVGELLNELKHNQDFRLAGWSLTDFQAVWMLTALYFIAVKFIGPAYMKNRPAIEARPVIFTYNILMTTVSAYMVYLFLIGGWATTYSYDGCQPLDKPDSEQSKTMALACYLFYVTKYLEFLDTIFFIMRKKFHLMTFLHVFHHGIMPFNVWIGVTHMPGGSASFGGLINSFVHVIMYSYYAIACLGPNYKKYVWWKKYVTQIQIVQFIVIVWHSSQRFFTDKDCQVPVLISIWMMATQFIFIILFLNFYIQGYLRRTKKHQS